MIAHGKLSQNKVEMAFLKVSFKGLIVHNPDAVTQFRAIAD